MITIDNVTHENIVALMTEEQLSLLEEQRQQELEILHANFLETYKNYLEDVATLTQNAAYCDEIVWRIVQDTLSRDTGCFHPMNHEDKICDAYQAGNTALTNALIAQREEGDSSYREAVINFLNEQQKGE